MAKEKNNRFIVWGIVIIVILAVAVFIFYSNNPQLAPKTSGTVARQGDDACPNPTTLKTVCITDTGCYCILLTGGIYQGGAPPGYSCQDTAPPQCDRNTVGGSVSVGSLSEACIIALSSVGTPTMCSIDCTDKGVILHTEETSACCTKKKERDCRAPTTKVVGQ